MNRKTCSYLIVLTTIGLTLTASIQKIPNYIAHYDSIDPATEDKLLLQEKQYWIDVGIEHLRNILKQEKEPRVHVAKNVVIFIGDGMGITTSTAARIYKGQRNSNAIGEEYNLSFDRFPNVALVKTYNVDRQVPDSAGTATALFTGVKARYKTIGLDVISNAYKFDDEIYAQSKLDSFMVWAQEAGKDTGIITTTRITHATPAATYARINNRDWECDTEIPEIYRNDLKDIARQLIEDAPGKNFKVIMGGGQQQMGYVNFAHKAKCSRGDNLNLTELWLKNHENSTAAFVVNNGELNQVTDDVDFLLGLFDANHMPFELVRSKNVSGTPSLTDMTRKALKILKRNPRGFALMIEGGLIDQAHHRNYARMALEETAEFDNVISLVLEETGPETLVLVTADHSHAFTINGYPKRGNDILGFANETASQDIPYLTLAYGNGPGFNYHFMPKFDNSKTYPWKDISNDENRLRGPWYQHLATFARVDDTHGGEDVPIYAKGPCSYLIKGVIEQNYIAHLISYATCTGPRANLNKHCPKTKSLALLQKGNFIFLYTAVFLVAIDNFH